MRAPMNGVAAALAGVLFGAGLVLSGMTDPSRVQGFLDLFGNWDPTLAFVMGGALLFNIPAYWLTRRRAQPLFADSYEVPTRRDLDARLIGGAALFGIGWGLAGYCPGPAVVSLLSGSQDVLWFCVAMLAGMLIWDRGIGRRT
jgi:uncharacterized membrane protein YedE/YeeE